MDCDGTVVGVVEGAVLHIGLTDVPYAMEVDWVAPELKRLASVIDLQIFKPTD
jgi:hypothetical protein